MKFTDLLKKEKEPVEKTETNPKELITEATKTPEEVLRANNIKIKLITPTSFGTQITFARKYDQEKIKKLLTKNDKKVNLKFKGDKDIFIVQ